MNAAQLKTSRHALGLSAEGLAKLLGIGSGRTVRRWESGENDIPLVVQILVDELVTSADFRKRRGLAADLRKAPSPRRRA